MFEAMGSVLEVLLAALWPRLRGVYAWLLVAFTSGIVWFVAAGATRGATDPIALAGAGLAAMSLVSILARAMFEIRARSKSSNRV